MARHRRLFLGLALSALVGLMGNPAQAGQISLSVDLSGIGVIYTATSSAPLNQSVEAVLTAVNTALGSHGSAYRFTGLSAQSNYTGSSFGSLQTTFQLNTSGTVGTTAAVLSIDTTQTGFLSPVGGPNGTLVSTAGGSFNSTTGSLSYTSDFQGAAPPSSTLVFPVSGTNSYSGSTGSLSIGPIPSGYELSNHFLISLTQSPSAFLGGTGGVVVTVPEPSSIVTLMMGIPLPLGIVFGLIRRRRLAGA